MPEAFDEPGAFQFEDAAMPYDPGEESIPESGVAAVVNARGQELLAIEGVEGVGAGQDGAGRDAVVVYIREQRVAERLPNEVDAFPVEPVVTGEISAF
jgi:hypothetical protein